ncbi:MULTISPECIES: hypothetical protein [Actinoalloteichus]|uniref:Antibiotic biosynthesis monooxygenase n=1 Tax=Actinoalloteichus fjordicus TaxID=1612552 RepID=A0AAC9PU37_9PSEU|nr:MULTISPECIES: hypothetical protein [Actinoalloteichus]APU16670.1 hypothetical protein UA74_23260 [Actinoalloteichus fjordicus]APU22736.1 hypothetical protein UA75_23770 [Actinoalloteichus sp. GBA129-24]
MSGRREHPPAIDRADADLALMGRWIVDGPEKQTRAAEALLAERSGWGWLDGLISISCYASLDGRGMLTYSQWVDEKSLRHFIAVERPSMLRFVDRVVQGIERPGAVPYRVYRSAVLRDPRPHFERISITVYETAGPDQQHEFCDIVIGVFEESRPAGLLAVYMHASLDGHRVFQYMEWAEHGAYDEFVGMTANREQLRMLARFPGAWLIEVGQYRFLGGVETVG